MRLGLPIMHPSIHIDYASEVFQCSCEHNNIKENVLLILELATVTYHIKCKALS
jgi:hypothetical protein